MQKRVVLKISGEGLSSEQNEHFDHKIVTRIVNEVDELFNQGFKVSLVVGGGNFWRGGNSEPSGMDKTKSHTIGMLGTIMNAIYLAETFRMELSSKTGRTAVVMTPFEVSNFTTRFSKESAVNYLDNGVVPIFAGGTGHPFFSTDSIVAIRACELEADLVLFAKSVECVCDSDPKINKNFKRYKSLKYTTAIKNQLGVADLSAMDLLSKQNIPSVVFDLSKEGAIVSASKGQEFSEKIGATVIDNKLEDIFYK